MLTHSHTHTLSLSLSLHFHFSPLSLILVTLACTRAHTCACAPTQYFCTCMHICEHSERPSVFVVVILIMQLILDPFTSHPRHSLIFLVALTHISDSHIPCCASLTTSLASELLLVVPSLRPRPPLSLALTRILSQCDCRYYCGVPLVV